MLLASGCDASSSAAEAYAAARAAADYETAAAACEEIGAEEVRGDCLQATAARFGRFEVCEELDGAWREECFFSAAEHRAHEGDRAAALEACGRTRYGKNCEQHVMDGLAMELRDAEAEAVGAAWEQLAPLTKGKNTELDFWRSWYRIRLEKGVGLDPRECPVVRCKEAARAEVRKGMEQQIRTRGCGEGPGSSWPPGLLSAATQEWEQRCARPPGAPPPMPPPRPGGRH